MQFDSPVEDELARDRAWWDIYREAFPASEREPEKVILTSLERRVGLAFRARREGATVGIATTHLLVDPPVVFLVYLATERQYRGTGLGRALFEVAWSNSGGRHRERGLTAVGMVWEVDDPEAAEDRAEVALRERRLSFFERVGGILMTRRYLQPPLCGGEPVPMQLMFRPGQNMPIPDSSVVQALIRAMYFEKYLLVNNIPQKTLTALLAK